MPLAARSSLSSSMTTRSAKMETKLSAWTPLNHPRSNGKVFEERRSLLAKWFDRWSDGQRRAVLQDLVRGCSVEQLRFLSLSVGRRLPLQAVDFTCQLPRALCLYVFSFLDPRSLCRSAQVSWHWKSIVELDQLWMPKCLRLGWFLHFAPTPLEQGAWKGLYIQTVQELKLARSQTAWSQRQPAAPSVAAIGSRREDLSSAAALGGEGPASGAVRSKKKFVAPPWRDSDRRPKDTIRFNYLDNMDPIEPARATHTSGRASGRTAEPEGARRRTPGQADYKLRKVKSLMFLDSRSEHPPPPASPPQSRPHWASPSLPRPVTDDTAGSLLGSARWNAGIRPRPAREAVPRLGAEALRAWQRSLRSAPSKPLLDAPPWTLPAPHTPAR